MQQSQPSNQLFTIALARPDQAVLGALTQEELLEYSALLYEGRRRDWLAGRLAAKRAVAARFGIPRLGNVRLDSRPHQAPRALTEDAGTWYPLPANVSVSHADGWGVAAIAEQACRIGVDIDRRGGIDVDHVRYFMTPGEARSLGAGDPALFWIQKEAAWKAFGLSDADAFTDLELDFGDESVVRGAVVRGTRLAIDAAVWAPAAGLIAAAVWTTKEAT